MGYTTHMMEEMARKYTVDQVVGEFEQEKKDIIIRNSGEDLEKLIEHKNIERKALRHRFGAPNINNWLNGKPISREKAIELCFFLNLDIDETKLFLQKTCKHDWFHLRDYKDIIYYFCLVNDISYERTKQLTDKYSHFQDTNPSSSQSSESFTQILRKELENISRTEEDLCKFLDDNKDKFGSYNNTAYNYFKEFVHTVKRKKTTVYKFLDNLFGDTEDKNYLRTDASFDEIYADMRLEIPDNLNKNQRDQLTLLQRYIYDDAPPKRPSLTAIYNQKPDTNGYIPQITRKSLIIIWLFANEYDGFTGSVELLNDILIDCGMPWLDAKNPFDFSVINALHNKGIETLEEIIKKSFNITEG